jgi:hypothetical protein
MTGKLEKELIKATKFKPPKGGYSDRQEELKALARLGSKLPDDDFDDLTNEAGDWVNAAVKAIMAKTIIKDFADDAGSTDEDDGEQEHKDSTDGNDSDAEADAQAEADAEADNEGEEAKKAAKPAKAKKPKKAEPLELKKPTPEQLKGLRTRYDDLTGEMDRYGVIIGTKTHDALKLYEKGVTAKELLAKLGGRFYNILRKVSQNGHLVERSPEGIFTVVHKDDVKEYLEKRKAEKPTKKGKKK